MAYIGNEPKTASFPVDYFTGDNVTVGFTLQSAPASSSAIHVAIDGITQAPNTYSVSGLTLTFTEAPPTTTVNNVVVVHMGLLLDIGIPSDGTVTYAKIQTVTANKVLGRTSESAGIPQEITLGSGLQITSGVLNVTGSQSGFLYENDQLVTANYTITSGKNAMSAGPITIDTGVTVTVPSGSVWTIV
jgi:Repeat of unknown function (DUF5907)